MIKFCYKCIQVIVGIIIFLMLTCSLYILWDNYRVERNAYNPLTYTYNQNNAFSYNEIQKINKDIVGWIAIKDTHINYPVLQGENNLEYLNKDMYGNITPTGSIYLSAYNSSNFNDEYNVIYGHHVNNDAMFGEIVKYTDTTFFNNHKTGLLITSNKTYNLTALQVIETDAYDKNIYQNPSDKKASDFSKDSSKILALSTCAEDETTTDRIVLITEAIETENDLPEWFDNPEGKQPLALNRKAQYWALLNLLCLILTIYTFLGLHIFKKKFCEHMSIRFIIGLLIEFVIAAMALILFLLTENIWLPIRMIDDWTIVMIILAALNIMVDVIFCRRKEEKQVEKS